MQSLSVKLHRELVTWLVYRMRHKKLKYNKKYD
jgi:hypothetical protein